MKKYKDQRHLDGSDRSCLVSGLKLTIMFFVIIGICVLVFGCRTQKEPCGNYDRWKSKVKFRSK